MQGRQPVSVGAVRDAGPAAGISRWVSVINTTARPMSRSIVTRAGSTVLHFHTDSVNHSRNLLTNSVSKTSPEQVDRPGERERSGAPGAAADRGRGAQGTDATYAILTFHDLWRPNR